MFLFLKKRFWNEEKPCRREFLYIILLLGSLTGIPLMFTAANALILPMVARLGHETLAAYSHYSVMSVTSVLPGPGWYFFVLLGSFLLMRRVLGKKFPVIVQVLGGVAVYYFFVSPQTIAYAWLGKDFLYSENDVIQSLLEFPVLGLKISSLCNFLIGGVVLLIVFLKLQTPDTRKENNSFLLNRIDYLYQNFYLGLIALVSGVFVLVPTFLFRWNFNDFAFRGLAGILSFGILIWSVLLMVRRMRHSRFSAHWLWGLLLIFVFLSSPLVFFLGLAGNINLVIGIQRFLGWGFRLIEILIIVLFFAPAAKGSSSEFKKAETLVSDTADFSAQ